MIPRLESSTKCIASAAPLQAPCPRLIAASTSTPSDSIRGRKASGSRLSEPNDALAIHERRSGEPTHRTIERLLILIKLDNMIAR